MISYTKRYVNIVSLLITILIYSLFILLTPNFTQSDITKYTISNIFKKNPILVELRTKNINQETKEESKNNVFLNETTNKDWRIIIPKISLEAEICEGTSNEVMNKYIGHFEETSKNSGNIGLAAHNRGYDVNYFANIKKLKEGDEIVYKYNDFQKTYIVLKNIIITDTDWSYLKPTEKDSITLITCVENEPHYRRCIYAMEKYN